MTAEMFLPGRPPTATAQTAAWSVRHGRPVSYQPETLKLARATLMEWLAPHRLSEPIEGPVRVTVKWLYPGGSRKLAHDDWAWKTTRPDLDNLQKLLQDCMTQSGFWGDDNQVTSMISEKFWVREHPGIWIRIETLGGED